MEIHSVWTFFLFCACWITLIVGAVLGYLIGGRMAAYRERHRLIKGKIRDNRDTILLFQREKNNYIRKINNLEENILSLTEESELYKTLVDDLQYNKKKVEECERLIHVLSFENSELKNDNNLFKNLTDREIFPLLLQMKKDPLRTNLSRTEWTVLLQTTDQLFNSYLSELREKASITRHEEEICCLIKWNFSRKDQMALFNNTSDALTKSKSRLKKRLQLDEKTDLDQFIRTY